MGISMIAAAAASSMYIGHQQRSAADDALNAQKESADKAEANRSQASQAPTAPTMKAGQAGTGRCRILTAAITTTWRRVVKRR